MLFATIIHVYFEIPTVNTNIAYK